VSVEASLPGASSLELLGVSDIASAAHGEPMNAFVVSEPKKPDCDSQRVLSDHCPISSSAIGQKSTARTAKVASPSASTVSHSRHVHIRGLR
jgi:hypothetical protein